MQQELLVDVLFTLRPVTFGRIDGGIHGSRDLFVSVMRRGSFGFAVGSTSSAGYYAEKLNMGGGITTEKLAELINGIRMLIT